MALEALAKDSALWHDTSTVLGTAQQSAAAQVLTDTQLTWASQDGLQATYDQLRVRIADLLGQGQEETRKIAATLLHVKTIYESSDQKSKNALRGVWDIQK
ncbi:MAG: hypothetical protein DLM57_04585 [Pseudonocardiales bacterium]|nr:MAG: hypothetical protein DLM57_04585 [Pseudonocardiales bacterium]